MHLINLNKKKIKPLIVSCNIRSLQRHFDDVISSPSLQEARVICLQETWLLPSKEYDNEFEIKGMKKFMNNVGPGRGIVTYCEENFELEKHITSPNYQMTKIKSSSLDIINIYISSSTNSSASLIEELGILFDQMKNTVLIGDLNICAVNDQNHDILRGIERLGFKQKIDLPTHTEGRQIDHVYFFYQNDFLRSLEVLQSGQFFTDHDLLVVNQPTEEVIITIYTNKDV